MKPRRIMDAEYYGMPHSACLSFNGIKALACNGIKTLDNTSRTIPQSVS